MRLPGVVKHAFRIYFRDRLSSSLAVAALGVSIAVLGAITALNSALTEDSPSGFVRGTSIVTISQTNGTEISALGTRLIEAIDTEIGSIRSIAGISRQVLTTGEGINVSTEFVTDQYFSELQPKLHSGRGLSENNSAEDPLAEAVVSYRFWQTQLGGDPEAIGNVIQLASAATNSFSDFRLTGVMDRSMQSTFSGTTDVWLHDKHWGRFFNSRSLPSAVARLQDGASIQTLNNELLQEFDVVDSTQNRIQFDLRPGYRVAAVAGTVENIAIQREAIRQLRILTVGSILLALLAASNVSLYVLSLAPRRRRELAIRLSIGATLVQLARQMITEVAIIASLALALGLVLSLWLRFLFMDLPFLRTAELLNEASKFSSLPVVALVTIFLTAIMSIAPVLAIRNASINEAQRLVSARAGLGQRVAGTIQFTLAGIFASVALAFGWHIHFLQQAPNFDASDVYSVTLEPGSIQGYSSLDVEANARRRDNWRETILALPGIEEVAFGNAWPGHPPPLTTMPHPDDQERTISYRDIAVDEFYSDLFALPIVEGRRLEAGDSLSSIVVNEAYANMIWGTPRVAGRSLYDGQLRIVGVMADANFGHPAAEPEPMALLNLAHPNDAIIIRSRMSKRGLQELLQTGIENGQLDFTIQSLNSISEMRAEIIAPDQARRFLAQGTAAIVMLLTVVGFYGMQNFIVRSGWKEYAIRSAIGAGPRQLLLLVLRRSLALVAPGLLLGMLLGLNFLALMRGAILDESLPIVLVSGLALMTLVILTLLATLGPAYRVSHICAGQSLAE